LFKDIEFDVIITNPPFGVNIKYKEVFKDNIIDYKEIYPIVTNNGTSLFIQMIMYKLKIGGICAIVLPDGELMSSNNTSNINMRKFILDNAKIIKIIL
jgi:type I restriction-modification system DNA methylase subunit